MFLWKGHITRNVLPKSTVCLSLERGGLGVPCVRLKCRALFLRQIFRCIQAKKKGFEHYNFWLGSRLEIPQLTNEYFHLERKQGRVKDSTSEHFLSALKYVHELFSGGYLTPSEIFDVSTKDIYSLFLEDLPHASIEDKFPNQSWPDTWSRLKKWNIEPCS